DVEDWGEGVIEQPGIEEEELLAFARGIVEEAQQDIDGIHGEPLGTNLSRNTFDNGEQSTKIKAAGGEHLMVDARVDYCEVSFALKLSQIPTECKSIGAHRIYALFKRNENAGLAVLSTAH